MIIDRIAIFIIFYTDESTLNKFNQRNITIAALSLSVGIGFTTASEIGLWHAFPEMIQSVFSANVVAVVFVTSIILNLVLPKNMDIEKTNE